MSGYFAPETPCTRGCGRLARHDVTIGPTSTGAMLCCEDMHEFMREVGKPDPNYKAGWKKFKRQHLQTCGYEGN